jgi:hypothetical protein
MKHEFHIPTEKLTELKKLYPNMGKNSHVGEMAVRIVELYFQQSDPEARFKVIKGGGDLAVDSNGCTRNYEVKGTVDADISWSKLKVSSKECHDALKEGMTLIRVTSVGESKVYLHFLQYGTDFTLAEEARWAVKRIRAGR